MIVGMWKSALREPWTLDGDRFDGARHFRPEQDGKVLWWPRSAAPVQMVWACCHWGHCWRNQMYLYHE